MNWLELCKMATQHKVKDSVPLLEKCDSSLAIAGFLGGEQKPKMNRHKALEDFPQKPDAVFLSRVFGWWVGFIAINQSWNHKSRWDKES